MSDIAIFSPVTTQKASNAIYEQIRDRIIAGELLPGDKLPSERALMEAMQRSRPTVREALRMLENAGLVQIVPGSGAVVKEPTISSVQQPLESIMALQSVSDGELFEYRSHIEEITAGWAAERRTEEDLVALRECIEALKGSVDNFDEFLKLDVQFRVLISKASHNRLAIIMESVIHNIVVDMITAAFAPKSSERRREINLDIIKDNQRIYHAIEERNSELARKEIYRQSKVFLDDNILRK